MHAEATPHVDGDLNYLAPMTEKPWRLLREPKPGEPVTNAAYEPHRFPIRDARPLADGLSLDEQGFALVPHRSAVTDFDDWAQLRDVYYAECERLVAEATGASRVVVFDHTIRRRFRAAADTNGGPQREAVTRVHNDYTDKSAPQRVRDLMGEEADDLLTRRFAIVNVWRPIRGPLRDMPLAVCDAGSVADADWVPSDLIYADRTGETLAIRHNPAHRWFYVPAMTADEALLLKCFDSARDGRARYAPHSAFVDPTTPGDALPRESIEIRTLAFFD